MRWLKNNLSKCDKWLEFENLIEKEDKDIPLISYVLACNPQYSDQHKTEYANKFTAEALKYKRYFKSNAKREFAQVLLWDVRDFVTDKETLKKAATYYFKGRETEGTYQDIQRVLEG